MTCISCGQSFSWVRMVKLAPHVHSVIYAPYYDAREKVCGLAFGADIEGERETFVCLEHAMLAVAKAAK